MAAEAAPHPVVLADATDLDGFRLACRRLVAARVEPARVSWFVGGGAERDLFAPAAAPAAPALAALTAPAPAAPALAAPAAFVALCQRVLLHRDPNRFGLMYRLLWRLLHEPGLRHDPLDADAVFARHLAQAVRRDLHKMKAFVRFRPIDATGSDAPAHIAWFEPGHHIVAAAAPFFARRFTAMRWAILTPDRCVRWDGRQLEFGPGAARADAPSADAGERLWLTYYEHIFNPARLKLAAMQKEMPRRYWHNLPEAVLIAPLAAAAGARTAAMVDAAPTEPPLRLRDRAKVRALSHPPPAESPTDPPG